MVFWEIAGLDGLELDAEERGFDFGLPRAGELLRIQSL
jgi:hypothetical protein